MIVMTMGHADFRAALITMSYRQSAEEILKELGYRAGVDFQTTEPRYFIRGVRNVGLIARDLPFIYGD